MAKAIVLLSGGIDSATALWWVKKKGWEIYALTFKYGNWNINELKYAKRLAKMIKVVKHFIVDANFLFHIQEDLKYIKDKNIRRVLKSRLRNFPLIYIPSRNTVFFGIASHFAEIYGINCIITGHIFIDPFPDSKSKYVKAINNALNYGSWLGRKNKIKIIMPFAKMSKMKIIELALKLKVPLELTWSCHKNGKYPCGKCNGCMNRLKVLDLNTHNKN